MHDPDGLSILRHRAIDLWLLLLFTTMVFGVFYPLESYLSLGHGDGLTNYRNLPVPTTTITLILSTGTLVALGVTLRRRGPLLLSPLAIGFLALVMLTTFWSLDRGLTIQRGIRLIPLIGLGVILPQYYRLPKLLRLITYAALLAGAASLVMSVAAPGLGASRLGNGYESAWRGATVHKNLLGFTSALAVLLALAAWRLGAVSLRLAGFTMLLNLFLLARSQSGTGALACGTGFLTFGLASALQLCPRPTRPLVLLTGLLLSACALVGVAMALETVLRAGGRDLTLTGRTDIWEAVWTTIQAHPIRGYGYGFWFADSPMRDWIWKQVGDTAAHSHNSWLDTWLQLGLPGLTLLVLIVFLPIARCFGLVIMGEGARGRLGVALLPILTAILIRSISEVEFTEPLPQAIPYVFLVYTILQQSARQSAHSTGIVRHAPGRLAAA